MGDITAASRFASDRAEFTSSSGLAARRTDSRTDPRPDPRADLARVESRPDSRPGMTSRPSDRVELSERGRYLSQLAAMPAVRSDLVTEIRGRIAKGTYETHDKLDRSLDGLIQDLDALA
jgi:anti-sigma28 factor (negative regulator of flagellin synthesis)